MKALHPWPRRDCKFHAPILTHRLIGKLWKVAYKSAANLVPFSGINCLQAIHMVYNAVANSSHRIAKSLFERRYFISSVPVRLFVAGLLIDWAIGDEIEVST